MIEIDGSHGEGGGQLLRTSLALSIITGKSVYINNIRAGRPTPGLKPQHYSFISLLKTIANADVNGLRLGATEITFNPGMVKEGNYQFDVGTAGSIVLLYQAAILSCLKNEQPITLRVKGGTDVKWAPSWDYFTNVFLQALQAMGITISYELHRRGYYPKGGGLATIMIQPVKSISALTWDNPLETTDVYGIIHSGNLPNHIGKRMKNACLQLLIPHNLKGHLTIEQKSSPSPGTGITLFTRTQSGCIGSVGLGQRGVPAELIAKQTTEKFISYMQSESTVDSFLFDQILPFLTLGKNDSTLRVEKLSNHAKTHMWLLEQFIPHTSLFNIDKYSQGYSITIHGQGLP